MMLKKTISVVVTIAVLCLGAVVYGDVDTKPANEYTVSVPDLTDRVLGVINPTDPALWDVNAFTIQSLLDKLEAAIPGFIIDDANIPSTITRDSEIETLITPSSHTIAEHALGSNGYAFVEVMAFPAAASITEGAPVYGKYDVSQELMAIQHYDANAVDADTYYLLGIALESGSSSDIIDVWVGKSMIMNRTIFNFATATWGKPVWSSTSAGAVTSTVPATVGDHLIRVGTALDATHILYRFSIDDTERAQ